MLNGYGEKIPPVADFAKAIGVTPGVVLGGVFFVVGLVMMLFNGLSIVFMAGTVVYPGLMSIRAIESEQKQDDKYWLTYWMIFGIMTVAETFLPFVFYFVPYWFYVKPMFFLWLIKFNGAQILFESVLRELLHKYKPILLEFIKRATEHADKAQAQAQQAMMNPSNMAQAMSFAAKAQEKIAAVSEPQETPRPTSLDDVKIEVAQ